MVGHRLSEAWRLYAQAVKRAGRDGFSMRFRLFLLLLLFGMAIVLGLLLLLLTTGIFHSGMQETKSLLENELAHRSQDVYRSFGDISVQGVSLAETLSQSLERGLADLGTAPGDLAEGPEQLEQLLEAALPHLAGALEKVRASGAFLVLDATVNPALPGSSRSRAGLYLKNMEPNIVSDTAANLRYLVGPMSLARSNGLNTLPQWSLEFDVSDADWFAAALETARARTDLPVSRLYHWSGSTVLPGSSEKVMLCAVPLVATDGTVLGACGFEVSEMLFKLSHAPDNSQFEYLFCMLSPLKEGRICVNGALFAGSYAAYPSDMTEAPLEIRENDKAVARYVQPDAEPYAGFHTALSLYPADSAYAGKEWVLALMMPEAMLSARLSGQRLALIFGLGALLLCSVAGAAFISRRYIRPVVAAFQQIKEAGGQAAVKTRIPEIDDLIEYLAREDEAPAAAPLPECSPLFQQFVKNIDTLSAAERAVFDLYMQGCTAKEIADLLCLSINTIKTHNRRIYMKLNVTSRKELMVYIQMMEEAKHGYGENAEAVVR